MSRITKIIEITENHQKTYQNHHKRTEITGTSCRYILTGFKNEKEKNSGSFVYFHIFFDEIISILLTVIKVTFLNPVNIYLQDVLLISVCLEVILVFFFGAFR